MVERLFLAGADVFRINMSHASHDGMRERIATIRAIEKKHQRPIGILVDLQGPKLRCGEFKDGSVELNKGDRIVFDSKKIPGDATRVNLPHPEILRALKAGDTVLIDDGKMRLQVVEAEHNRPCLKRRSPGACRTARASACPIRKSLSRP